MTWFYDSILSGLILWHGCRFSCQDRVVKTFSGIGYLGSYEAVVRLWHSLVNLYIWLTILSCYDSIPLALEPIGRDGVWKTLCHSGGFACQQGVLKTFPAHGYVPSKDGVVWLWHSLVNLYIRLDILSCSDSIPLALGLIRRDVGLSTRSHGCGFPCHHKALKKFPGSGYLSSEGGVVWLWHSVVNLYIWLTILSCCDSISLTLGLTGRHGGLSTLCYGCRFACQQRVLKTFPGAGYLRSKDGVVWLWHSVVNLYTWLTILYCYVSIHLALGLIGRDGGLITLCHCCGLLFSRGCQKRFLTLAISALRIG